MIEHFALVFAVAFAAAVASFVSYDGGKGLGARGAIAIILLLAVSRPIIAFATDICENREPTFSGFDAELDYEYEEVAMDAFKNGIIELLAEEYSLERENFSVKTEGFDFSTLTAEKIYVTLYGRAAFCDPLAVERLIENYGLGECYAQVGI